MNSADSSKFKPVISHHTHTDSELKSAPQAVFGKHPKRTLVRGKRPRHSRAQLISGPEAGQLLFTTHEHQALEVVGDVQPFFGNGALYKEVQRRSWLCHHLPENAEDSQTEEEFEK